jgi:hypothetical protein
MRVEWWSAKVRVLCLVENSDPTDTCLQDETVVVFRADDEASAFERALALGRERELEYLNGDGDRVRWRLARVLKLTRVNADDLDGAEIHSELSWYDDGNPAFDTRFAPEREEPERST